MPITLSPLTPGFACEVGDVDLIRPLDDADLAAVRDAFARFAVLVFPSQDLTVDRHLAFAKHFGPLERSVATVMPGETLRVRPEIADIANLTSDGLVWAKDHRLRLFQMGNRLWHTDSSFKQPTGYASMLYARSVAPIGGHTEFADLRAAWDALDEATRARVDGLIAEHSLQFSRCSSRAAGSASPTGRRRSASRSRRSRGRWCARSRRAAAVRSTSRRTSGACAACPTTRPRRWSRGWWRTRPSAASPSCTAGASATW